MIGLDVLICVVASCFAGVWLWFAVRLRMTGRQPESNLLIMAAVVAAMMAWSLASSLSVLEHVADVETRAALHYFPDPTVADYLPRIQAIATLACLRGLQGYIRAKARRVLPTTATAPIE